MNSMNDVFEIIAEFGARKVVQGWDFKKENYSKYRGQVVWDLLSLLNISEDDLNSLNIIHVDGSKGKGSTCTFIESILRKNGMKTGLFVSPHLRKLTERISINGQPIKEKKFVEVFQSIWTQEGQRICDQFQFPPYMPVLFSMAIREFIDEKVDVAIIEVGKGGEYDPTNIIPKPLVCAVTLLEVEHSDILGNDIASIAWHKSGIFKPGSRAFTIPQKTEAMEVLKKRAQERNSYLELVPELFHFESKWNKNIELGLKGKFQSINASLAIEVSLAWMQRMGKIKYKNKEYGCLPEQTIESFVDGLKKAFMMGRMEIIERPGTTYYVDFAHTQASLRNAVEWFKESSAEKERKMEKKMFSILVLHIINKDLNKLIPILQDLDFDKVVFPIGRMINDFSFTLDGHDTKRYQQSAEEVTKSWKYFDPARKEESYETFGSINEIVAWIAAGRDEKIYSRATEFLVDISHDESLTKVDHVQVFIPGSFGMVRGFCSLLLE